MALCQCLTCDVRLFQKLVIIHNLRWQELNTSADISRKTKSQHIIRNGFILCTKLLSKTAINHDHRWVGGHLVRKLKGVGQVLPLGCQNHDVTWCSRQLFYYAHLILEQLVKTPKTNLDYRLFFSSLGTVIPRWCDQEKQSNWQSCQNRVRYG